MTIGVWCLPLIVIPRAILWCKESAVSWFQATADSSLRSGCVLRRFPCFLRDYLLFLGIGREPVPDELLDHAGEHALAGADKEILEDQPRATI